MSDNNNGNGSNAIPSASTFGGLDFGQHSASAAQLRLTQAYWNGIKTEDAAQGQQIISSGAGGSNLADQIVGNNGSIQKGFANISAQVKAMSDILINSQKIGLDNGQVSETYIALKEFKEGLVSLREDLGQKIRGQSDLTSPQAIRQLEAFKEVEKILGGNKIVKSLEQIDSLALESLERQKKALEEARERERRYPNENNYVYDKGTPPPINRSGIKRASEKDKNRIQIPENVNLPPSANGTPGLSELGAQLAGGGEIPIRLKQRKDPTKFQSWSAAPKAVQSRVVANLEADRQNSISYNDTRAIFAESGMGRNGTHGPVAPTDAVIKQNDFAVRMQQLRELSFPATKYRVQQAAFGKNKSTFTTDVQNAGAKNAFDALNNNQGFNDKDMGSAYKNQAWPITGGHIRPPLTTSQAFPPPPDTRTPQERRKAERDAKRAEKEREKKEKEEFKARMPRIPAVLSPERMRLESQFKDWDKKHTEFNQALTERDAVRKGRLASSRFTDEDIKRLQAAVQSAYEGITDNKTLQADEKNTILNKYSASMNKFEAAYKEQNESVGRLGKYVMTAFSALQVSSMLTKNMLTDPFQYTTQPTLQAMGQTGAMGGAMSSALGVQESFKLDKNQDFVTAGMGIAGASMMLPGLSGKMLGGALGAGTAILGLTGAGSGLVDKFNDAVGWTTSPEARQNDLAKTFTDPKTLINRLDLSKNIYTAMGGAGLDPTKAGTTTLGNFVNNKSMSSDNYKRSEKLEASATGNYFIDKVYNKKTNGASFANLGYDADQAGQMLAMIGGSVNNKNADQKAALTSFALSKSNAFGADAGEIANQFRMMQSVGVNDLRKGYNDSLSTFADEKGQISQFAATVLQPALAKVAQGLSMRSFASDANKLTENVNAFQRVMNTDLKNTEFGKRMSMNPELMADTMQQFSGAMSNRLNSTQGLFQMRYIDKISNPLDLIRSKNDPKLLAKVLDNEMAFYKPEYDKEGKLVNNTYNASVMKQIQGNLGFDDSKTLSLMEANGKLVSQGKSFTSAFDDAKKGKPNEIHDMLLAETKRNTDSAKDDLTKNKVLQAQQNNAFEKTVLEMQGSIKEMQTEVLKFATSAKFYDDLKTGFRTLMDKMNTLLGGNPDYKDPTPTTTRSTSAEKKATSDPIIPPMTPGRTHEERLQNRASVAGQMRLGFTNLMNDTTKGGQNKKIHDYLEQAEKATLPGGQFENDAKLKALLANPKNDLSEVKSVQAYFDKYVQVPPDGTINGNTRKNPVNHKDVIQPAKLEEIKRTADRSGNTNKNMVAATGMTYTELMSASGYSQLDGSRKVVSKDNPNNDGFDEDAVLDKLIRKAQTKMKNLPQNSAQRGQIGAGISALQSLKAMPASAQKENAVKMAALSAAQSDGTFQKGHIKVVDKGKDNKTKTKELNWDGTSIPQSKTKPTTHVTSPNAPASSTKPNTPQKTTSKTTPQGAGNGRTGGPQLTAQVNHNGNESITINIDGAPMGTANAIVADTTGTMKSRKAFQG